MFVVRGTKDRISLRAWVLAVSTGLCVLPAAVWANSVGVTGLGLDGVDAVVAEHVDADGMSGTASGVLGVGTGVHGDVLRERVEVSATEGKFGESKGHGAGSTEGYAEEFWEKQYRAAWVLGASRGEMGRGDLPVGALAGQLGLWGLAYEGGGTGESMGDGLGLKAGRFGELGSGRSHTNKDVAAAVAMLERLTGTQTDAGWLAGGGSGNRSHEALYSTSVPLPAALPMGLALLGGLGLWRAAIRKRRGL